MLETPKAEITFDQVTKALSSVPDEEVFTRLLARLLRVGTMHCVPSTLCTSLDLVA
jgi:hypothetical protein